MFVQLSIPTLVLSTALSQALLGVGCWRLLRLRHGADRLIPWALAALCGSGWMLLLGLRGLVPDWASYQLANFFLFAWLLLSYLALRRELPEPPAARSLIPVWVGFCAFYALLKQADLPEARFAFTAAAALVGSIVLARTAGVAARTLRSRSGHWLAWLYWAWVVALSARIVDVLIQGDIGEVTRPTLSNVLTWSAYYALAVLGNVAYLGMTLEQVRHSEARAQSAEYAERARREAAEQHAGQLREALRQLDNLAREREQLLGVLAHEIRQPLHRATGALHSAGAALRGPRADVGLIGDRLDAAESVLSELRAVLDNTLAAAQILTRGEPLTLQDVDLDLLLELVLGDLSADQRLRVRIEHHTRLRTLEVEPGLVRLALRNLLRNAFLHGGAAQSQVLLRVEECETPYGMALSVCDHGDGLSPSHWAHLDDPVTRDKPLPSQRGQGLGLSVVRQIMALHGGQLLLRPVQPSGLQATLLFPWPDTRLTPRRAEARP